MDIISREAFWRIRQALPSDLPGLPDEARAEVIVVGGGISGAMIAHELVRRGHDTLLLDRFDFGAGSTSGSTALVQAELDQSLAEISEQLGQEAAELAYLTSFAALDRVRDFAEAVDHSEIMESKSYYLASRHRDVRKLQEDCEWRKRLGLPVEFLSQTEIKKRFSFSRPGALVSNRAYQLDPFRLTRELIRDARNKGLRAFDRSNVLGFRIEKTGIRLDLEGGKKARARRLVFATGYEAATYLPRKIFSLHSTYAMVSKPIPDFTGWYERVQLWETARPYLYLRTTKDSRAIIGGLDETFKNAMVRDALLPKKSQKLQAAFHALFPKIEFEPAYTWAGTFGETKDSLPYIGSLPKFPGVYFCCGYAGNGVTFSAVASGLIPDLIEGRPSEIAELFGFSRK